MCIFCFRILSVCARLNQRAQIAVVRGLSGLPNTFPSRNINPNSVVRIVRTRKQIMLLLLACMTSSGCRSNKPHQDLQISLPDTIFADSCIRGVCHYTLRPKVTSITPGNKIRAIYIHDNCVRCNYKLSAGCGAEVIDDSIYWFSGKCLGPDALKEFMVFPRRIESAYGSILDAFSRVEYSRVFVDSPYALVMPIPVASIQSHSAQNSGCRLAFIESLTESAIRDSAQGVLKEQSFLNSSVDSEPAAIWSRPILLKPTTPYERALRRARVKFCRDNKCEFSYDTIVNDKLIELVKRHSGFSDSISRREVDSITFYSHDRSRYMRFNELHPELGEQSQYAQERLNRSKR